eukprot:GFKZ01013571.1.p1 GENE.GFKZ01013571.1~~GFKZ01013571.1.p1  ORF type:complete len:1004 (-),score=145.48 GFKZ01013571.1:194-3205(-)
MNPTPDLSSSLHHFYSPSTPSHYRASLHNQLLHHLSSPACHQAAEAYLSNPPSPIDPYLLHFYLHSLHLHPPSESLLPSVISLLITLHSTSTAPHLTRKASTLATQIAVPAWLQSPLRNPYPQTLQSLVNHAPTSPRNLACIATGATLATTLVELAAEPRHHVWKMQIRRLLVERLKQMGSDLVDVLEIAARMAGTPVLAHVKSDAIFALGRLGKLIPQVADPVRQVLMRCSGAADVQMVSALCELMGEGVRVGNLPEVEAHCAGLLEEAAMGERGGDEYCVILLGYTELVARRVISTGGRGERLLNGLMGLLKRARGGVFVRGLECWSEILEVYDEEEKFSEFVEMVVEVLSNECLKRCFWATNSSELSDLQDNDEPLDVNFNWDEMSGVVAEVVRDVEGYEAILFVEKRTAAEEWEVIERKDYIQRCIEVLMSCIYMDPRRIGGYVSMLLVRVWREKYRELALEIGVAKKNDIEDLATAAQIARSLGVVFQGDQTVTRLHFETTRPLMESEVWKKDKDLGVAFLRAFSIFCCAMREVSPQVAKSIISSTGPALSEFAITYQIPARLACAAALVVLSLHLARPEAFPLNEPPLSFNVIATSPHGIVSALGIASAVQWAIVPPRDRETGLPVTWEEGEWQNRQAALQMLWSSVFARFCAACNGNGMIVEERLDALEKGAGMIRMAAVRVSLAHGSLERTVFWRGFGKLACEECVRALQTLAQGLGAATPNQIDAEIRNRVHKVMGVIVGGLQQMLRVCRHETREMGIGHKVVSIVVEIARVQDNVGLAKAALRLVQEEIGNGKVELLKDGVELGCRCLSGGDVEVGVSAVGMLADALKMHWGLFWHADLVDNTGGPGREQSAGTGWKEVYVKSMEGIVGAVENRELGICRAGLLGLLRLDASRRLFAREEAFIGCFGKRVVLECLKCAGIVQGRESLWEEAVDVLWGIARSNWVKFREVIGEALGSDTEIEKASGGRGALGRWLQGVVNDYLWQERRKTGGGL